MCKACVNWMNFFDRINGGILYLTMEYDVGFDGVFLEVLNL